MGQEIIYANVVLEFCDAYVVWGFVFGFCLEGVGKILGFSKLFFGNLRSVSSSKSCWFQP